LNALQKIRELKPSVVIPGHSKGSIRSFWRFL
jgi:hypothetical protein